MASLFEVFAVELGVAGQAHLDAGHAEEDHAHGPLVV